MTARRRRSGPAFVPGDRVALVDCPSPGTVVEERDGSFRVSWDDFPNDHRFYPPSQLVFLGP
jgi:hypothetical protein